MDENKNSEKKYTLSQLRGAYIAGKMDGKSDEVPIIPLIEKSKLIMEYHDTFKNDFGISLYRGVIVIWDEDHDTRILAFIDMLTDTIRKKLLYAAESKGTLRLLWDGRVPSDYREHQGIDIEVEPYSDWWEIVESESCKNGIKRE